MEASRSPGQRAGLTRERVLAAARELLAERGLEALTMRALAERLDVRPNAIYSHVESKTALVWDVLDDVLADVDAPDPEASEWRAALHDLMTSTYDVLLRNPDLVPVYLGRGARGPNAQRLGQVMEALLARGGVTGPAAREALRVLVVHTIGFAAFATQSRDEPAEELEAARAELAANFERGLDWLLTGIASKPARRT